MSLNPLTPVTDYQSMLNRIFWFTSAAALAAVWMLRMKLSELDALLRQIDFTLEFGGDKIIPIPGGYLLPALATGLGSRVFRIHGLIARWLGIRERFEIDVIIAELAKRTGVDLDGVPDEVLANHRQGIMRQGFYQFVSGRRPIIDEQLVHRALDLWSWFWIGVEATVVFVLASFVLLATGFFTHGLVTFVATIALAAIGLPIVRHECHRYAVAQVRAIVDDAQRVAQVRQAFDDIVREPHSLHRAA